MTAFRFTLLAAAAVLVLNMAVTTDAFMAPKASFGVSSRLMRPTSISGPIFMVTETEDDGIIELADEVTEKKEETKVAPFLSQGEIAEDAMEMDLSDPKQARVIFYIILSLIPVLFLIPLMLGSRELIPLEAIPPVQM
jgi:hypothetical protein